MDRDALALAAGVFEEYRECDNAIRSDGNRLMLNENTGRPCINPLVKLRTDAWNRYMKALIEFGMTPVARCRIQVKEQPRKNESKAEKFFG
jgi:P27 family predicted phage terminase small subunit